jgi:hypothetical protein
MFFDLRLLNSPFVSSNFTRSNLRISAILFILAGTSDFDVYLLLMICATPVLHHPPCSDRQSVWLLVPLVALTKLCKYKIKSNVKFYARACYVIILNRLIHSLIDVLRLTASDYPFCIFKLTWSNLSISAIMFVENFTSDVLSSKDVL